MYTQGKYPLFNFIPEGMNINDNVIVSKGRRLHQMYIKANMKVSAVKYKSMNEAMTKLER